MLGGIINDGKLVFNYDHMEHMDYVWESEVLEVLCKYEVSGDICFTSHDGDNAGQEWGYRFDGHGGQVDLVRKDKGWEETGTCHPRGKGVLTCKCGHTKFKTIGRKDGPPRDKCLKCGKFGKTSWVYPFPGGKYVKPEPDEDERPAGWRGDVLDVIECEGFDYGLRHYTSFKEIKDKKFHQLRKAYIAAADALEKYISHTNK